MFEPIMTRAEFIAEATRCFKRQSRIELIKLVRNNNLVGLSGLYETKQFCDRHWIPAADIYDPRTFDPEALATAAGYPSTLEELLQRRENLQNELNALNEDLELWVEKTGQMRREDPVLWIT